MDFPHAPPPLHTQKKYSVMESQTDDRVMARTSNKFYLVSSYYSFWLFSNIAQLHYSHLATYPT